LNGDKKYKSLTQEISVDRKIKLPRLSPITIDYAPGHYIKEFDGWRGVGILFVILAHSATQYFIGAWIFMEMFFVMSGFLITGILVDTKPKPGYYKNFMARRIVRVFPLYYLSLIIFFFVLPETWMDFSYYNNRQAWYWLYGTNWLMSIEGRSPTQTIDHFWSLAIEEQFYITWPLMVWIFSRKNLVRFCLFLFVASYIFRNIGLQLGFVIPFPYVATLGRMEPIVLGSLIALLVRSNKSILEKITPYVLLIFGLLSIVSFIYAGSFHMDHPVNYRFTYTMVDIFFAGMITLTLSSNLPVLLRRIFRHPFIIKVGVMSYGLYIFHNIIFSLVEHNYKTSFVQLTGNEIAGHAAVVVCALLITAPVVYTIHKYIEVPLWKFKRYF
jgi:peptidoglycan/LPS O-acetylase OafA/YrhL